jgi:7-cyano-7-deazaguanine tRNA-ribosyltransferase
MFEIRVKDAMGRIGTLNLGDKKIETPLIFPVINPNMNLLPAREIREIGFQAVITNSYIIYKNPELKERALSKGVKSLLGFGDGAVMTDSGSYQLYQYGQLEIAPDEIVRFQEDIGSDIGVILDVPTPPDASRRKAEKDLDETLKRAKRAVELKKNMLLAGTVQGSTHMDLREKAAKDLAELDFDIYPIGGVVPLMENYRFADLARTIVHSKKFLPPDTPVHLFGGGHPVMFALAVALGCDFFDSAAYFLYAKDGRYITNTGTLKLEKMHALPCQCPVCSNYSLSELKSDADRIKLLATHNLHVTSSEIKIIKEAIWNGSLWELVETRCRAHPHLLDALRVLKDYPLERYEPLSKPSAFFYTGSESLQRPEVKRHIQRLSRIKKDADTLVLLSYKKKPGKRSTPLSNKDYHVCFISSVFGIIPTEIEEVYPLSQHVSPSAPDKCQLLMMKKAALEYSKDFDNVLLDEGLDFLEIDGGHIQGLSIERDTVVKMIALGDYQFGERAGRVLFKECRGRYSRNGRLRHIYDGDTLVATVRASDGVIVPALEGAKRLLKLPHPSNRVVIDDDEVCGFVRGGKSVFAKFVTDCDPELVPGSEVIVVDMSDELVNWGRAVLDAREIVAFKVGVGVKIRGSLI